MFLSMIVPVYNAEPYLSECLESLLRQDLSPQEYEIICVNDGSTDGSLQILRDFSLNYPNLRVLNQGNSGVVSARNTGLAAATGDYIWFIDADDLIGDNVLSCLKSTVATADCDLLQFRGYQFQEVLTAEEANLAQCHDLPDNVPGPFAVVWRSLFRRLFLLSHDLTFRYPELTHGEDGQFMYELSLCHPKTFSLSNIIYFYRVRVGSAETSASLENQLRKARSHIAVAKIMDGYYRNGRNDRETANRCMETLWYALYSISALPLRESRFALSELWREGLFPFHYLPECNLTNTICSIRTVLVDGSLIDFTVESTQFLGSLWFG